ncbi:hypothetical protein [Mucilaginibacter pedocola]|uniref:hypothetical protein n=1 Tax=Mucilaginibacter pedocola TaxID=1792845 RepID=UPI0013900A8A|nr:hypothetical protein [Mucilaginibacter pedocola]
MLTEVTPIYGTLSYKKGKKQRAPWPCGSPVFYQIELLRDVLTASRARTGNLGSDSKYHSFTTPFYFF